MSDDAILHGKLASEALFAAREDVLTSSVLGAIACAPAGVRGAFLQEIVGADLGPVTEVTFEFWPWMRLDDGRGVEPDAWIRGPQAAVVVEAKAGAQLLARQLEQEGQAARRAARAVLPVHLLTIDDPDQSPAAVADLPAGLFASRRHVSWGRLYQFLSQHAGDPELDGGARRLLDNAARVLERFDRRPYRGMSMADLDAIEPGLRALGRLAEEMTILHRRLAASLADRGLALNDPENKVLMDGTARAFDRPDAWAPRQLTLSYAPPPARQAAFYFVRVLLRERQVWIGLSFPKDHFAGDRATEAWVDALRGRLPAQALMAGVRSAVGQPFELVVEPRPIGLETVSTVRAAAAANRLELVEPGSLETLSGEASADAVEQRLLDLIDAARGVRGLEAP